MTPSAWAVTSPAATPTPVTPAVRPSPDRAEIAREVGQVMMVGFQGALTPAVLDDWTSHRYGGLLIVNLNHNGTDLAGMRALIASVRAAAGGRLIAATDEEGNGVCTAVGSIPCRTNSPADVGMMTKAIAGAGFDLNLAPVADVAPGPNSIMYGRSYGADPQADANQVGQAVDAVHGAGLLAAAKHFPGHGDTSASSEDRLPVIDRTRARLQAVDWVPFRAAIAHGVDFVMVGHLAVTGLEPGVPATISPAAIGALRSDLGWKGAVISDDLEMGGVTGTVPTPEAAVRFLLAGGDLVMVAHHLDMADRVFDAIEAAVLSGRLPRARLDEAAARVAALERPRP